MGLDDRSEGSRLLEQRINAGLTERQRDRNFRQKLIMAGVTGATRIGGGLLKAALDKAPENVPPKTKEQQLMEDWAAGKTGESAPYYDESHVPEWLKTGKSTLNSDTFADHDAEINGMFTPKRPDAELYKEADNGTVYNAALARDRKNTAADEAMFNGHMTRSGARKLADAADVNNRDLQTGHGIIQDAQTNGGMMRSKPYMPWGVE